MGVTILVLGDAMIDETIPVKKNNEGQWEYDKKKVSTGGAANVFRNCYSLGWPVGRTGLACARPAVYRGYQPNTDQRLTVKCRYVDENHQVVFRADLNTNQSVVWPDDLVNDVLDSSETIVPVLVDYGRGFLDDTALKWLMPRLVARGVPILVDPGKRTDWTLFSSPLTIFKFNRRQSGWLRESLGYPAGYNDLDMIYTFRHRLNRLGVEMLGLCTTLAGAGHLYLYDRGGGSFYAAEGTQYPPVNAVDVCGAGDTFLAGMAVVLAGKLERDDTHIPLPMQEMCDYGERAARISVTKPGVVSVTRQEVEAQDHEYAQVSKFS